MGAGKASEGHGFLGHSDAPATPPSLLPQPTLGHYGSGTYSGYAQLSRLLAWMVNEAR